MSRVVPASRSRQSPWTLERVVGAILHVLAYLVLIIGIVVTLYPLLFMAAGSLKSTSEIFSLPPTLIPSTWRVENYPTLFTSTRFPFWYLNSLLVVALRVPLSLFLCSLGAFALAKYHFPGNRLIFWLVIAVIMVPFEAIYIPLYFMMVTLKWTNSFAGLIIPFAASAFGIFMIRQYMVSIPDELIQAAKVDGASGFWIYWRIMLPLCRPALGAMAIIFFLTTWNSFLWPLVILQKNELLTLPLGMVFLLQPDERIGQRWHLAMAATTLATLPLLFGFLAFQRQFIAGLTTGGVKGL